MKVLVIGSGGREHTLVWKLSKSKLVEKIYCAPGNAGTSMVAENIPIKADDLNGLLEFAKSNEINLTVVGPELPLVMGIADLFQENKLKIFGSNKEASRLEGSKVFSKLIMKKAGVPTADFKVFDDSKKAIDYVNERNCPLVVKADGLAAGKGVYVCKGNEEAVKAINEIMVERIFGDSGSQIIVEEMLKGHEASILAFCDGKTVKAMIPSQDHKQVFDNDKGANTGGMGAYAPTPLITKKLLEEIIEKVFRPTLEELNKEGIEYKGVLYAGLMIDLETNDFNVLEFNVRFGDPETQAVLPLMESDLAEAMLACSEGKLDETSISFYDKAACCVVLSSKNYPGRYEKGKLITGLDAASFLDDVFVFHAGTKKEGDSFYTAGGRVLGVTALGDSIENAIKLSYEAVEKINFEGMHFRKDIGMKSFQYE